MNIVPQGRWVLVKIEKPDTGKIVLPDGKASADGLRILRVVEVGEGLMASDGTVKPFAFGPGDEVIIEPETKFATPNPLIYPEAEELHLIDGKAIIGVVRDRGAYVPPKIVKGALVA